MYRIAISCEYLRVLHGDCLVGMSKERVQLRVCTLNCWALPQPWPIGSKDRLRRLECLAEALIKDQYDVVGLEELWSERDFHELADRVNDAYPYSHYFHSGWTGSGVCVLSRHPIVSTLANRYSLNGFVHHVHRGDWFGGKIVGMAELEIGELRVNFYVTHLHAEYDRENDLYLSHRVAQSFELAQFIRHTSKGASFSILTGDLNLEPDDLGYRIILANGRLHDSWVQAGELSDSGRDSGMTCDRPDNCYTPKAALKKCPEGKRLDYILFKSGTHHLDLLDCQLTLHQVPGEAFNYSDHTGVCATFSVETIGRQMSTVFEPNHRLLNQAIEIVQEGRKRAHRDRTLYYFCVALLLCVMVATLFVEDQFPFVSTLLMVLRFVLTLVVAFCLWYGFIGLTLELKSLKAAKQSMQKLLND